jgi:hypothetical protein
MVTHDHSLLDSFSTVLDIRSVLQGQRASGDEAQ